MKYTTKLPGLSTPVVTSFPIEVSIVPAYMTNQRPGIKARAPRYYVQHETGNQNWGANADGEKRWLHSGAGGQQSSFHFAVDDTKAIILVPLDEVTWQAADGGGPGNMNGISCELCVGKQIITDPIRKAKSRANAEELCAVISTAFSIPASRIKQHNFFHPNNKNCPMLIRNEGYWPTYLANVAKIQKSGGTTVPTAYAKPVTVWVNSKPWDGSKNVTINNVLFHADKRAVTTRVTTNVRQWASTVSDFTRAALPANTKINVLGWVEGESVSGNNKWWIDDKFNRISAVTTTEQPKSGTSGSPDQNPTDDPTAPIVKDGRLYYRVGLDGKGREVTVTEEATLYKWADFDSAKVGSVHDGQKVKALFWCSGEADKEGEDFWWILEDAKATDPLNGPRLHVSSTGSRPL
jgi:N-acetylmuramoyl-L-alanine amidase CwlA